MREAQVNLAIRWFVGYALHEALPDHSSLTRIRQRWGADVFRQIFIHVVRQCQAAGLVSTETVHIDASLIRANVSMDALVSRHLDAVEAARDDVNGAERDARTSGKFKLLCRTDPDATMATSSRAPLCPAYKQHTAVDDFAGVVVDVEIVTGEEHDTGRFDERLEAIEATLGVTPGRITADRLYGIGRIYAALEDRRIAAVIPPLRAPRRKAAQGFPTERFKFDPHHDVVRCPARRRLTPRNVTKSGQWYRADRHDCARCPLKAQCLPRGAPSRRVHIVTNHAAILRARRKRLAWGKDGHANRRDHRREAPLRQQIRNLPGQPLDPRLGIGNRVDIVLQDDLLRRIREAHQREPPPIGPGPAFLPRIDLAVAQQKALQVLARLARHPHRRCPRPDQIAHRLMRHIRKQTAVSSPDRCSFAGITASRRSVFIRSPAFTGISDGATTMQPCPISTSWR
ncbi:transposase [Paracoccus alcaliphilus]|uniref:transposase n=1 Tax=Paracoccus alcaliphilus TaxID=34002 RepID=UPI002350BB24|nr:transposase [Paracoccus alcaliphilus]WCR18734.1 transposase [Paracoccus alcaliphilus]